VGATGGSADPRIDAGGHTGDPVTYAGVTQAPTGAPGSLDDAAGQVLRGVGGTSVQGVQASSSPAGLVVTVALKENNDDVPDIWLADLAVGALGERASLRSVVRNLRLFADPGVGVVRYEQGGRIGIAAKRQIEVKSRTEWRRYGAGGMHPVPPAFHWQAGLSGPPITCVVVSTTTRPALTSAVRKSRNVLRSPGLIE
jgi:hypothetical protein